MPYGGVGALPNYGSAIDTLNSLVSSLSSALAGKANASAVPTATSNMPMGIADVAAQGSDAMKFEPAGHVHPSKARKAIATVNTNVGTYTWTYPTAFGSGVVPRCSAIAQTSTGVLDLVNVQIEGDPTNTQCVFRIARYSRSFLSLLGLDILSFNTGAISVKLHMLAFEP